MTLALFAFRRTFGALEREQWDELLECITLHTLSLEPDSLAWHLEPNGLFSTKSLYQAILASPGPTELTVLWEIKLPLKICIFLWQWVRDRSSGTSVMAQVMGSPSMWSTGRLQPYFISLPDSGFLRSCLRDVVGGAWCHDNLLDMSWEILSFPTIRRPWVAMGTLTWTLWNVRDKLVVKHIIPRHVMPFSKCVFFLQLWKPLSKRRNRDFIDAIISGLRSTAAALAAPSPPPHRNLIRSSFIFLGLIWLCPQLNHYYSFFSCL